MSTESRYIVPSQVTPENFSVFFENYNAWKLSLTDGTKKVIIDFQQTTFVNPILIAYLTAEEDDFKKRNVTFIVETPSDTPVAKFLRSFRVPTSNKNTSIQDAYEKNLVNCASEVHRIQNSKDGVYVTNQILPKVLRRINYTDDLVAALNWAIGEFIENAGNHGYQSYELDTYLGIVYVCAFSYTNKVQIVVLDKGQGIISSLSKRYPEVKPKEMINHATKRGVTGHPVQSPGFGLYGSSKLAKEGGGNLYIISEGYGLKITNKSPRTFVIPGFEGTLISIDINAGTNIALSAIMGRETTAQDYFELHEIEYGS